MGFPNTVRIAHVVKFVLEEHYALVRNYGSLRPFDSMTMLREVFSRGIFHLYISLSPYYTERVLKASSI